MTHSPANPAYWRRHARRYDRATLFLNRRLPALAAELAEDLRGRGPVLELAAGTGLVTVALAPAVRGLVATDRSPEMLEVLRARLAEQGATEVQVRTADALALDAGEGTFEAVVAANLLHLLPDPGAALREAHRVLAPGGLLAVPTFAHGETGLARVISRLLALTGFPIVTRFGGNALRSLVEAQGFTVLRDSVTPGLLPIRYVLARRP